MLLYTARICSSVAQTSLPPRTSRLRAAPHVLGLPGYEVYRAQVRWRQRWAEDADLAVVMPSGDNAFYVNGQAANNDYGAFIGEELPRAMRSLFPLSNRRGDTFIAGLSMGALGQSVTA